MRLRVTIVTFFRMAGARCTSEGTSGTKHSNVTIVTSKRYELSRDAINVGVWLRQEMTLGPAPKSRTCADKFQE